MSKLLFNVVDAYETGNYIVVRSDIPETGADYRHGDVLELKRPDGTSFQAQSEGVFYDPPTADRALSVAFKGLKKDDIPIGSQVWLVISERRPRKASRHYETKESSRET